MEKNSQVEIKIYLKNIDKYKGESLWHLILERVKNSKLGGATIYKAIAGVGHSKEIHTFDILNLSQDIPLVIEIIDDKDEIDNFLRENKDLLSNTFITLKSIDIVKYLG